MIKRLNIDLSTDIHRNAKAVAALGGKTLKDFIKEAILEKLKKIDETNPKFNGHSLILEGDKDEE